jgi:ABC-2 type transport system permease protein
MLISQTGIFEILFFSVLWNFLYALIRVLAYLVIGVLFFKADMSSAGFIPASIIILISTFIFSGAGIISASLLTVFKKGVSLRNVIFLTSTILGGVYFPVETLPRLLQKISYILPITHALKAMREVLINGHPMSFVYKEIIILVIFASILFPLSIYIFKKAFRQARAEGSLTHY